MLQSAQAIYLTIMTDSKTVTCSKVIQSNPLIGDRLFKLQLNNSKDSDSMKKGCEKLTQEWETSKGKITEFIVPEISFV